MPEPGSRDYYRNLARSYATQAGIDPDIFEAQINQESGFDPTAGSYAGAQGIAQIIPRWHPDVDPWDPEASLRYAANLMAGHLQNYGGDIRQALTAYHAGSGILGEAVNIGGADWETRIYVAASGLGFDEETSQRIARDNQTYLAHILGAPAVSPTTVLPGLESHPLAFRPQHPDAYRQFLRGIQTTIYGKPADEISDEPFPGYTDLLSPYQSEYENLLTRQSILSQEIEDRANHPPTLGGALTETMPGIPAQILGFIVDKTFPSGLFGWAPGQLKEPLEEAREAHNQQMEALRLEYDASLARQVDLANIFTIMNSQVIALSNADPTVRADAQALVDQRLSELSPQQRTEAEPLLDQVRTSIEQYVDDLSSMSEEEANALTQTDITERLFEEPRARPVASYQLTTDQLRLSLRGFRPTGPPEEMTGEQIRQILMAQGLDDPELEEYRTDTTARVTELLDSAREMEQNIAAMRSGEGDWMLPKPGVADYLKMMAVQPMLVASMALEKYYRGVVQPITGSVAYGLSRVIPGEQQIERDMDAALKDNNRWTAAGEAWRSANVHPVTRFAIETVFDPASYIGWGIAPRLLKPLPFVGRRLSSMATVAEHAYLQAAGAPFRMAGTAISKIPKPASTMALLERGRVTGLLTRFISRANPQTKPTRITGAQTTEALSNALKIEARAPDMVADMGVGIGRVLRALPTPGVDEVVEWTGRVSGTVSRDALIGSKNALLDIETLLVRAIENPDDVGVVARQLMSVLGVEDSEKGFQAVQALVKSRIGDANRQAQRLIKDGTQFAIIEQIAEHASGLTLRNRASASARIAEQRGILSFPLSRLPEGAGALWSGSVEKFLIKPMARSYLLFGFYHLWNVAETRLKVLFAGKNPFGKSHPQMYFDALADSIGGRPEVLMGKGSAMMLGETVETVQRASMGMDKFFNPNWVRRLFRESLATKSQAYSQSSFMYQLTVDELKRVRSKEWGAIQQALDEVGMDFNFLPRDLRPWAQDATTAAILRNPQAVRDLPQDITTEALRAFNTQRMVSKYDLLDDSAQQFVVAQAENGRLFTETDDVVRELTELTWERHLRSPEFFSSNFEDMVEEVLTAPMLSEEDFFKRLITLQGMSRGYGDVLAHQYTVAREASEKVIKAADNDHIWELWRKGSDEFGTRAANSVERHADALRRHLALTGERSSEVDLLMNRYIALKDLDSAAYAQRRTIAEQLFTKDAPAGSKLRSSNEWWASAKDKLGSPFREAAESRKSLLREILTLERKIGNQPRFPVPDSTGRNLSRADVAVAYGIRLDDVSTMTFLTDLQAMMGRDDFIDDVLHRVLYNIEPGQDPALLGWTEERIGTIWDDIMRELRLNPKNVSSIAPSLMQIEGMKREVMATALESQLPKESAAAFRTWADDLAGKLEGVAGYWEGGPGRVVTLRGVEEEVVLPVDKALARLPQVIQEKARERITRVRMVSRIDDVGTLGTFEASTGEVAILRGGGDVDNTILHEMLHIFVHEIDDPDFMKDFIRIWAEPGDVAALFSKQGSRGIPAWDGFAEEEFTRVLEAYFGGRAFEGITGILRALPDDLISLLDSKFKVPGRGTPISWLEGKGKSLQNATDEFFQTFPDYIDLNYVDTMFRSQMPFWVYEFHRLFYLPRQFMRTPGLITGMGRYNEATGGDNYMHVPFTSMEINPLRGTILMGGLRRLLVRDYPEYYDVFPKAQQALDFVGRFGFYPGAHVSGLNVLLGTMQPGMSQFGELVPVWMKAPVQGFQAVAELTGNDTMIAASRRLADIFIPERYRDYMIAMKVSQIGTLDEETNEVVSGASLLNKRLAGTPLTEAEQDLWDRATGEMSPTFILMDQTAMFRFRPEEMEAARTELNAIVMEYTGLSEDQLDSMRNWGVRWQDIFPPTPEIRELLNATEALQRWSGFTTILHGAGEQNFRARRTEFWDEIDGVRMDIKTEHESIDCQFGFVGATQCDHPGSISAREWVKQDSGLGTTYGDRFDGLRGQDRYKDIPVTREEVVEYYQRTGQPLPVEHPMVELLRLYYDIQLEDKFDPETGQSAPDYFTFYAQREILLQAAGERRDELEAQLERYETDLGKLHRWSYTQYLKPYYNRRELTISRYPPEMQAVIRRWLASDNPLERDQLEQIQSEGRSMIGQYNRDMRVSSRRFRFYSPDVDAWLAFWQVTDSFATDEGQRRYVDLMRRYRPGGGSPPPVEKGIGLEGEVDV